jgi:hypothetical protein
MHYIEIEAELGITHKPVSYFHPLRSLFDAAKYLVTQRKHKLPLIDHDAFSGQEFIVSVITEYRLLKFIAINVSKDLHFVDIISRYGN